MNKHRSFKMKFIKLNSEAVLPTKAHPTDAGYDLFALENVTIPAGENRKIPTGIGVHLPPGTYARICDRSGFSSKNNCTIIAGRVDESYTGDLTICMSNLNQANYSLHLNYDGEAYLQKDYQYVHIKKGDKIAQLIVIPIINEPVEEIFTLPKTERNDSGWGSSGS